MLAAGHEIQKCPDDYIQSAPKQIIPFGASLSRGPAPYSLGGQLRLQGETSALRLRTLMDVAAAVPNTPLATPAKNAAEGNSNTTDSKAGTAGKQLTREQLLDYIKKQKVVIKRLEKENEVLVKKELEGVSPVKPAPDAAPSPSSGSPAQPQSAAAAAAVAASSVQQAMRNPGSASEYDKRVLKVIIGKIIDTLANNGSGRRFQLSKKSVFLLWRHKAALQSTAQAVHKQYEDAKAKMVELEQKNAKLKSLLARSHQANQRNAEDSTVLQKAQREALVELKNIKQKDESERLALMETVRVQSIQSAFHSDIELSIQKAAQELLNQQKLILSQQQQQAASESSGNVSTPLRHATSGNAAIPSPSSSYSARDELERTVVEKNRVIFELEREAGVLVSDVERYQNESCELRRALDSINSKMILCEQQNGDLIRKIEEQNHVIGELEVEIDITLSNRAKIVEELEAIAESNANKRLQDIQNELAGSKDRIQILEQRVTSLTGDCDRLHSDNEKLKASSAKYINQSAELERLRFTLSNIKRQYLRSAGVGGIISKSGKEKDSNHPLVVAINTIISMSLDSSRKCIEYSDRIASLERHVLFVSAKYKFEVPYLWSLCSSLLTILLERVSSRCSKSLLGRLSLVESELKDLENSARGGGGMLPLVYETSSITVSPGKDLSMPIIISKESANGTKEVLLEWRYYGDGCHLVTVALVDGFEEIPLGVHSTASSGNKEFIGRYIIRVGDKDKNRAFRIRNPSWGQATLGYHVQLKSASENGQQAVGEVARLTNVRDSLSAMVVEGEGLKDRFVAATRRALHAYKKSQRVFLSELYSSSSSIGAVRAQVAAQEACRTSLQKLHRVVAVANSYMDKAASPADEGVLSPVSSSSSRAADASFSCESCVIRAKDEFRLAIPTDLTRETCSLTYEFRLNTWTGKSSSSAAPMSGGSDDTKRGAIDIGFSVLEKLASGSFRQLVAYKRVGVKGEVNSIVINRGVGQGDDSSIFFLFDNTYSYFRAKDVSYSVRVDSIKTADAVTADGGASNPTAGAVSSSGDFAEGEGEDADGASSDDISDSVLRVCKEVLDYVAAADNLLAAR